MNRARKKSSDHPALRKGQILVALPMLLDPNFRQSLVLLCEHGPDGSLGLILNRPTGMEIQRLMPEIPKALSDRPVYNGGPVAREGLLILCRGHLSEKGHGILEDVFLAKDLELLTSPHSLGPNGDIRFYLGYAGWAPGQLEAEIKTGAWHVRPADSKLVFDSDPTTLWSEAMRQLGEPWAIYSTMPLDPSLN